MKNTMTNNMQKVKDDLLAELDKRVADKIIEKTNADLLKKLINQAETINEAIMIAELGTTYKRTGFHFDKRLEKMTDTIKYFKKNEKLSFVQEKNALTHKLIIGDNYDALLNLLIEYRGKIDVIYIDPPYGKDSMGEFAQTNYENAITRDNLLSMLYPRLVLARQLLSDSGVIFCSIDDKNQAYVKGLFDEVFGEWNFVSSLVWKGRGGRQDSKNYAAVHEFVLVYGMEDFVAERQEKELNGFTNYDKEKDKNYKLQLLRKWGSNSRRQDRPNLYYAIKDPDGNDYFPKVSGVGDGRWRWALARMTKEIQDGNVEWQKKDNEWIPYEKVYEDRSTLKPFTTWLDDIPVGLGAKEIKDIFVSDIFAYPKPTALIKRLIEMGTGYKDATILDFFAGSGTTGQAVLELNKQDGGRRQFILVNTNEITDTTPNGIVYDVTSKRLKRVMTGECYDGTKDFKWNEKNKPLGDNLDVYDIATVANFEATEGKTPFEVIDETLYGQEKMQVKEKIQWVCENFEGTQKKLE
jgi:adenine-specific DNA-methyltransferase